MLSKEMEGLLYYQIYLHLITISSILIFLYRGFPLSKIFYDGIMLVLNLWLLLPTVYQHL